MKTSVLILVVLLMVSLASASYISIAVGMSRSNVFTGDGELNFSVGNFGDETAFDVQMNLRLPEGLESEGKLIGSLVPNSTVVHTLPITVGDGVMPGEYIGNLLVSYADANSYPFSMANPIPIVIGERGNSRVNGSMDKVVLFGEESVPLNLVLNNNDVVEREVTVLLYASNELRVDSKERVVIIAPGGEAEFTYDISSFGALAGSRYMVFAVASYEDTLHYSNVVGTLVEVQGEKGLFSSEYFSYIAIVVVVLVLIVVYMQLKR